MKKKKNPHKEFPAKELVKKAKNPRDPKHKEKSYSLSNNRSVSVAALVNRSR